MSNWTTVPSSRGGFKSLPAELKVGGGDHWRRMRAQFPGYGSGYGSGYGGGGRAMAYRLALGGRLGGLGDCTDLSDPSCYTGGPVDVDVIPTGGYASGGSYQTLPPDVTPPPARAGTNWAKVIDQYGRTIGQVLAISQGGSTTELPNGLKITQGSVPGAIASSGAGAAGAIAQAQPFSVGSIAMLGGMALIALLVLQSSRR